MKNTNVPVFVSLAVLAAGCAYHEPYSGSAYSSSPAHAGEVMTSRDRADRALEAAIRDELNHYGDLASAAPNVQIIARDGAVTLSGTVPTQKERDMIEACARNTSGVVAVNDQLALSYPPTGSPSQSTFVYPGSQPAENLNLQVQAMTDSDRGLAQRIIDGVRTDSVLPTLAPSVNITVTGGRVVLEGTVSSRRERKAIEDAVRRVSGVVDVRDELRTP